MKLRIITFILVGSVLLSFRLPQTFVADFLTVLNQKLTVYENHKPQEKIYLQTDKPFCQPGEDIWFSTFVVNGTDHTPTSISGVVYVELINPKGAVERKLTLPVKNGHSHGNFNMDESLVGGLYKIRAYTLWMKNLGEDTFFEKEIQLQKVITPRLLMKLDFEKKAYGANEKVTADFEVKDLAKNPLIQEVSYVVQLAGKNLLTNTTQTNYEGKSKISFKLPEYLENSDGLLNIVVNYEGKTEAISRSIPIVLNKIDMAFFPEGGDLVENVSSKVGFKALNEFGKPADVEGFIADKDGKKVTTFKSFHDGIGAFEFTPESDNAYKATITSPKISRVFNLPVALPKGFALQIAAQKENELTVSFHTPVEKHVYIVAQIRGKIIFSEEKAAQIGKNTLTIPLKKAPAGIMQVTLFDYNQIPRCERLVFVNAHKKLNISVTTDKKQYMPREKVEMTIKTTDEDNLPLPANLAVSVTDDQLISFADDKQDNILSYLLVSSDVKGKIHEPSFYFKKDEPKAMQALDYLLMTQGWRRFTWKEVMNENFMTQYVPEKSGSVSGVIKNVKNNQPVTATVTLLELGNKNRSAQLLTKPDGSFVFVNIDPTVPIQIFAEVKGIKDNQQIAIELDASLQGNIIRTQGINQQKDKNLFLGDRVEVADVKINKLVDASDDVLPFNGNQNFTLKADVSALEEVVVIGYGAQAKKGVTGAVTVVESRDLSVLNLRIPVEQALQGRVAGVVVTQANTGNTDAKITIRGASSIVNKNPLYVIDGMPVENDEATFIDPTNIETVTVVKGASATAIYGSRGSNGVVVITTKNRQDYYYGNHFIDPKKSLANVLVQPRAFSVAREFPDVSYENVPVSDTRSDFRKTIYWKPFVETDKNGIAKLTFYNSDQITTFRITAEGIGTNGLTGRTEETYFTQQPFQMDAKIPPYLVFEDKIDIPVFLKNNTDAIQKGELTASATGLAFGEYHQSITLNPKEAKTFYLPAQVMPVAGQGILQIVYESQNQVEPSGQGLLHLVNGNINRKEKLELLIEIQPKGFPTQVSYSGKQLQTDIAFTLNEYVKGSLSAKLTAYPDVLSDLMSGVEGIFREPYGCFEQTSSSTYPNVLALQYIRETGKNNPEIEKTALGYIQRGYKRLIGYETSQHGFEWFGNTPPHEGLSAFGIMEFLDMKKVWKGVDDDMIDRTKTWLLGRRNGRGGFQQNTHGMDGFYGATPEIINSYIVFALCEAGLGKEIKKEYETSYQQAIQGEDLYEMALMANASLQLGEATRAEKLIRFILKEVKDKSWEKCKIKTSVTSSYGKSLQIETASLLVSAMLKTVAPAMEDLQSTVNYIISSRSYGTFGSTQATVLALKALTEYAKFSKRTAEGGTLSVYLNDKLIEQKAYEKDSRGEISIASLDKYMQTGKQQFKVAFSDTKEALPYSLNINWTGYTPNSSDRCWVDLETRIATENAKTGNTVRLTTILKNKTDKGLPMAVALVGIPSGLSLQPWQLKELQEKHIFDYYEIRNNYVIFYYKSLNANAQHEINLDLKAEIPGNYQAPASTAYLYYTSEFKDWEGGEKIKIDKP
jgi:TonB-dependent SusC/RagA subfamily outer membrane receptor